MVSETEGASGERVCWLDRLCDSCGAFVEGTETCWHCGAQPKAQELPTVVTPLELRC
jgi:hypothetical protein